MGIYRFVTWAAAISALFALAAPAEAQPRIDFGQHFSVRLHNQSDSSRDPAVGQSMLYFRATIADAAGGARIELRQGGRNVVSFECPIRRGYPVRCGSSWFDATDLDPGRPVEVVATHIDPVSDAETPLLSASFPVHRFWDWVGNRNGRPVHVEQRALRLDNALGVAVARQAAFGAAIDSQGNQTVPSSEIQFAWWDARPTNRTDRMSLRCKVGDGEWQGFRMSGPAPEGEAQEVLNRVMGRDGSVHEGEGQSIYYQQWRFTATMPFWVRGAAQRLTAPPAGVDGRWTCQVRDAERRVVRELSFDVAGNELVPHAAQAELNVEPGSALIGVALNAESAPVSCDPAEVRSGFFGMRWSRPEVAPVAGALPPRAIEPDFEVPRDARRARSRRRR